MIAAMSDQYGLKETHDLGMSLRARSDQILPRREVRKITDIPMGHIE
jgi:hypothetical protein